jgi:drug/metabolite transporter (DMT)-like permease
MSERVGYLLLVGSVLLNAVSYHLQRYVLHELAAPKGMVVLLNCFIAAALFVITGWLWRRLGWTAGQMHAVKPLELVRWLTRKPAPVLLATVCGAGAAYLISVSMKNYGAETTAFLGNQTIVFMVLGGMFFGERVRWIEGLSMLVIVAGAMLFSYRGGSLQLTAWLIMAIACLGVTSKQLAIRRAADSSPLPLVMAAMLLSMGLCAVLIAAVQGELAPISPQAVAVLSVATLVGSFLGMLLLYAGMGLVGVCRGSPVDGMRPLGVLLIGFLLGHEFPTVLQWIGAAMVLGGTAALAHLHRPGEWRPESAAVTVPATVRGA